MGNWCYTAIELGTRDLRNAEIAMKVLSVTTEYDLAEVGEMDGFALEVSDKKGKLVIVRPIVADIIYVANEEHERFTDLLVRALTELGYSPTVKVWKQMLTVPEVSIEFGETAVIGFPVTADDMLDVTGDGVVSTISVPLAIGLSTVARLEQLYAIAIVEQLNIPASTIWDNI